MEIAKLEKAYEKLKVHMESVETLEEFLEYFKTVVTTDDKEVLNEWLLKVLYVQLKKKHPFDELVEIFESKNEMENVDKIKNWLDNQLFELKEGGR